MTTVPTRPRWPFLLALLAAPAVAWAATDAPTVGEALQVLGLAVVGIAGGGLALVKFGQMLLSPVVTRLDSLERMHRDLYGEKDNPDLPGALARLRTIEAALREGETAAVRAVEALRADILGRTADDPNAQG